MKKLFFVFLLVFVFIPLSSFAGSIHSGTLGLGAHIAWWNPKDVDENTVFFGLQSRFRISDGFAVEGTVDYYSDAVDDDTDFYLTPVQASVLFYFIATRIIEVHGTAGAGWYFWKLKSPTADESGNELGYHLGAGGELPLTKHFALYFDARWVFFKPDVSDVFDNLKDWSGLWTNAGCTFYF